MAAAEKIEPIVKLEGWHLKSAEHQRNLWVVNAPQGAEVEDTKKPEFWRSVAMKLAPFDRVEVRGYDGTWMADCLVVYAERNMANIQILEKYEIGKANTSNDASEFRFEYKGPGKKWTVYRNSDDAELVDKIKTQDEAVMWIREHEKVLG